MDEKVVSRDSLLVSSFSNTFWFGKYDFSDLNLCCLCSLEASREGESINLNGIIEKDLALLLSYLG